MFRAITRVAGLIWKTRANQFVLLLVMLPRGRRGRGFCLFLFLVFVGDGGFLLLLRLVWGLVVLVLEMIR